ncbi:Isochorismatase family protein YecD [bacterium HR30]|nr:Isochorismatase family protein YecD [bacterium HR30]
MTHDVDQGTWTLDAARSALCIVEMQNDIVHESNIGKKGLSGVLSEAVARRGVVPRLREVLQACRAAGIPVFYINVANKPNMPRPQTRLHRIAGRRPLLVEGTWGVQVHEALAPLPSDFVLERCVGIDGSYGTQLYPVLRRLGKSVLLVGGVSTNLAVEGLVRGSVNRGFEVVVLEDCCASYPEEWHRFSIENIMPLIATVTDSATVLAQLRGAAQTG